MSSKLMALHQHELVETAKLFSEQGKNLRVEFHEGGAKMGDGVVYLPSTPPDVALSERGQRFDRAMVDHEAGHHVISTTGPLKKAAQSGDKRLLSLVQGIEDCRVEHAVLDKYPGARKNLGTARDITFEGVAEAIAQSKDARQFASTGIINAWWEKNGGWPSANRTAAFEALPQQMQEFCRKYADLAQKLPTKRGSMPTVKLAEQALAELEAMGVQPVEDEQQVEAEVPSAGGDGDDEQQQQQQQQSSDGDGDDEQQSESGSADGAADDEQQSASSSGFEPGDEQHSVSFDDHHERVRDEESDGTPGGRQHGRHGDVCDWVPKQLRLATVDDWLAASRMTGHVEAIMSVYWRHYPTVPWNDGLAAWPDMLRTVQTAVGRTQAKLQEAFMSASERNWSGGYDQGTLDPKALVRAYQGRDGAFRRKDTGQDIDGAVTLLLDCSGSMDEHEKQDVSGPMTVALAMVLERMGVAVEVRGFTGLMHKDAQFDMILKPFDMQVSRCRAGLGQASMLACAQNYDPAHVTTAAHSLMRRPEAKRMLIVLSDGSPCGFGPALGRLCRALHEKSPIELLGVGIRDRSVEDYYPNHVVVNELSELSTVVAGRIAQTLLGRGLTEMRRAA